MSNAKPTSPGDESPFTQPRNIGLYGGSFDPIHHGHLILAREARELLGLEWIVFLPARLSPHKLDRPPADARIRWQMVVAALEDEPGLIPDDRELRREGPSYAIETVREFEKENPGSRIFYLIGEDNVADLGTWKESEELLRRVQMVVLGRPGGAPSHPWPVISRQVEISSTEIRNRVAQGRSVRYLMPEMSRRILLQNALYSADHG